MQRFQCGRGKSKTENYWVPLVLLCILSVTIPATAAISDSRFISLELLEDPVRRERIITSGFESYLVEQGGEERWRLATQHRSGVVHTPHAFIVEVEGAIGAVIDPPQKPIGLDPLSRALEAYCIRRNLSSRETDLVVAAALHILRDSRFLQGPPLPVRSSGIVFATRLKIDHLLQKHLSYGTCEVCPLKTAFSSAESEPSELAGNSR